MAFNQENVTSYATGNTVPPTVATGASISANTYLQMITVLENLATHNHVFYDDYTTVCECQCQCACTRGTL
jgi:hypothetical protein